jgi:hypothetical protein
MIHIIICLIEQQRAYHNDFTCNKRIIVYDIEWLQDNSKESL